MRTASWESSTGALAALLNAAVPLITADCYTLSLPDGSVRRWSGADVPVALGDRSFALGPGVARNRVRWVTGVEVSTLDLTLYDITAVQLGGMSLAAYVRARGMYGARVLLERAYWAAGDVSPRGALLWFSGRVAEAEPSRYEVKLTAKSDLELLDVMIPRDVYQAGCLNTLYDGLCGVSRAAVSVAGTATSATDSRLITFSLSLASSRPDGWGDLGVLTMTSGPNAGVGRTVKLHAGGSITVLNPWPAPVSNGDTLSLAPGCDKTQATCSDKFANSLRFRGMPYIPIAETIT